MAKKAYVRNSENTEWVELASATTDLSGYATKANPTFTGTVVLPSTTSVGNVTSTELGYLDGVTSAVQTQINSKHTQGGNLTVGSNSIQFSGTDNLDPGNLYLKGPITAVGGNLDLRLPGNLVTGNEVLVADTTTQTLTNKTLTSPKINENVALTATSTQLNRVDATSSIQTQLNAKAPLASPVFTGTPDLPSGTNIGSLTITSATINSTGNIAVTPAASSSTLDLNSYVRMSDVYNRTSTSAANWLIASNPLAYVYRSTASSQRWKNNIQDLGEDLDANKLLDLPVHQFKFNNDYLGENDQRYDIFVPGFIAEEVAEIYPIAAEKDEEGLPSDWNSRLLIPPMLKLIQDQANKIQELELRISNLENN
jgi:hypothetical protein